MALEHINDLITIHVPTKEPGFTLNDRKWTQSSNYLSWKDAAAYCAIRDTTLQTLDDAVEFRYYTDGANYSDEYQHTRTLIGYTNDGKAGLRAFIFEPTFTQLQELINHPKIGNASLQISAKDALAKQFKKGRTFLVPEKDLQLSVVDPHADGNSEYSSHEIVKLLMPNHAKDNAAYISKRYNDDQKGIVWFDRLPVVKGDLRVRPVGLGGDVVIDFVGAYVVYDRRARGVASGQKNSP